MSLVMLLLLLSVVSAAPVAPLSPFTPLVPHQQTVRGQLGVVLITDEVMKVRYVTTLDRTGGRIAKSWPQSVFGVDRLSPQNRRLATWFTHKEQPEVTRLIGLLPTEAFRGVSDVRGSQIVALNKAPGAYVNGVFSEAAFNQLAGMGLSGQRALQLIEQLGEHGSRTLETSVVKRGTLTLSKVAGQQCRSETVNGRKGRVCTVRHLSGAHQAVSAGDIQFTVRAVKAPEGVLYRIGTTWRKLNDAMSLADFRGAPSIEVFYPSKAGPQADATTVQRLEAVFSSASRKRFGDEFVIPIGRKHANSEVVTTRASLLTVEDKPTRTTYITTLNRSREQAIFGSWPPRGPYAAAWYLNTYRSPVDEITSVSQATPTELFGDFVQRGNKSAMVFSAQAGQQFQQGVIGGQQLLSADALMASGTKRKYQLNARKVGGITLLPAMQSCEPMVVKGVKGQSCELRRIEVNAQTLKSSDIHFKLSARLPYALQNQARYEVGRSGWVELGSSIGLEHFTQGGHITLFVPGDAVAALTTPRAVTGEFSSRSRGLMGDRASMPMMPKGSAPTAEVTEHVTLAVLSDEVTQSRYLASTSRSYGAGVYGSLTDPAQPVIWQVSNNVSQAHPRNVKPLDTIQGFANDQGSVQRGRRAPENGFVNPVLTAQAAERLAKPGGKLSLKMDMAQASGHAATFNINATTRNGLTLMAPATSACSAATVDGVAGMSCPVRNIMPKRMMAKWGDLEFSLTAKLGYAVQQQGRYLIDGQAYPLGKRVPLATLANGKALSLFVPSIDGMVASNASSAKPMEAYAVNAEVTSRSMPALHWQIAVSTHAAQPVADVLRYLTIYDEVTRQRIIHVLTDKPPALGKQQLALLAANQYGERSNIAVISDGGVPNVSHVMAAINVGKITLKEVRGSELSQHPQALRRFDVQLPEGADLSALKVCTGVKCVPFTERVVGQVIELVTTETNTSLVTNTGAMTLNFRSWGKKYYFLRLEAQTQVSPPLFEIALDGSPQTMCIRCSPGWSNPDDSVCSHKSYRYTLLPSGETGVHTASENKCINLAGQYDITVAGTDPFIANTGVAAALVDIDGVVLPLYLSSTSDAKKNWFYYYSTDMGNGISSGRYITDVLMPPHPVARKWNKGFFTIPDTAPNGGVVISVDRVGLYEYGIVLDGVYLQTDTDKGLKKGRHTFEFRPDGTTNYVNMRYMAWNDGFHPDVTSVGLMYNSTVEPDIPLSLDVSSVSGESSSIVRLETIGTSTKAETIYYRVRNDISGFVDIGRSTWKGGITGSLQLSGNVSLPANDGLQAHLTVYPQPGKYGQLVMDFALKPDFSDAIMTSVGVGTAVKDPLVNSVVFTPTTVKENEESVVSIMLAETASVGQQIFIKPVPSLNSATPDDVSIVSTDGLAPFTLSQTGVAVPINKDTNSLSFRIKALDDADKLPELLKLQINGGGSESATVAQSGTLTIDSTANVKTVTVTPADGVITGGEMVFTVGFDTPATGGEDVSLAFIDETAHLDDLQDSNIHLLEGAYLKSGDLSSGVVGMKAGASQFKFKVVTNLDSDALETFRMSANSGASYDASIAQNAQAMIYPLGKVIKVDATPVDMIEGSSTTTTLSFDAVFPIPRNVFVKLGPGTDPLSMIEGDDVSLFESIVGGEIVSISSDRLSGVLRVAPNASQVSFNIVSHTDGDVEDEHFVVSANPGNSESATGSAQSGELTITPSGVPTLSFISVPTPGVEGEIGIGAQPLKLEYGLSLKAGAVTPLTRGASEGEVARHLLQRAALALKLRVSMTDVPSAIKDGKSYCTLTSPMGQVAVPLKLVQDGGNEQEIDCSAQNELLMTTPSSNSGWTSYAANEYKAKVFAIVKMDDSVSSETVDEKIWFGKASAKGRLTASASME
ncbi:hypothetical protein [Aeromonas sp. CU5]|uniref:hypothetical protein n=1 Tax=Aeromonas sp. CU5 TaxID=2033033 RepID=UPI0012FE7C01|nr:hypothetical protein [Aeromonas sp. CU5]